MSIIAEIHNDLEKGTVRLMEEYRARLFSEAVHLCDNVASAEDLVSRTFVKVINNLSSYRADNNFYGWMKTILLNLHRNDLQRPVQRGTVPVDPGTLEQYAGGDEKAFECFLQDSDNDALRKAIDGLDSEYKEAIALYYFNELSLKEIAVLLSSSVSTVSRRLQLARQILAAKLGPELGKVKKPLAVFAAICLAVGALFGAYRAGLVDALANLFSAGSAATVPAASSLRGAATVDSLGNATRRDAAGTVCGAVAADTTTAASRQHLRTKEEDMNIKQVVTGAALWAAAMSAQVPAAAAADVEGALYVATTEGGGDDGNGHDGSLEKPFATVAKALSEAAATPGQTVYVQPGTYELSSELAVDANVRLVGKGARPDGVVIVQQTIGRRVLSLSNADAVVENLTLKGSRCGESIFGIVVFQSAGTLRNCILCGGVGAGNTKWMRGVGLFANGGLVTHCVISNNTGEATSSYVTGAGAHLEGTAVMRNTLLTGNTNKCYGYSTTPCLTEGCGILKLAGSARAENCTVADNDCRGPFENKAASVVIGSVDARCVNCLIADNLVNTTDTPELAGWYATDDAYKSGFDHCVFDVDAMPNNSCKKGEAAFVDAAHGNYTIGADSDAIDFGAALAEIETTDLYGQPRMSGGAVDAGCSEYDAAALVVASVPAGLGEPTPGYGVNSGFVSGKTVTASVPSAVWLNPAEDVLAVPAGWKLYRGEVQVGESADDLCTAKWTHEGRETLVWLWTVSNRLTVASADSEQGTVGETGGWYLADAFAPVRAVAADGFAFASWTGDTAGYTADELANAELFVKMDRPRVLRATFAAPLHVAKTGVDDDAHDGTAEKPFASVAMALTKAVNGQTIYVQPGEYDLTAELAIARPVKIVGAGAKPTDVILRREKAANNRVLCLNDEGAVIENLTLSGGSSTPGANPAPVNMTAGTLRSCVITDGPAAHHGGAQHYASAGLYAEGGLATHCVISNCIANTAGGCKGIAACLTGTAVLRNSLLTGNVNSCGNGVTVSDYSTSILYLDGSARAENCTIAGNDLRGKSVAGAAAAVNVVSEAAACVNCLVSGNMPNTGADPQFAGWFAAAVALKACYVHCLFDVDALPNATCAKGVADFVDAAGGNYAIGLASDAIDFGLTDTDANAETTDLAGATRVSGLSVDAGCYEADLTGRQIVRMRVDKSTAFVDETVAFVCSTWGFEGDSVTYVWDFGDGSGTQETSVPSKAHTYAQYGRCTPSVTVSDSSHEMTSQLSIPLDIGPKTLYVSEGGGVRKESPYGSWETAASTLQEAYDAALPGAEIVLGKGEYNVDCLNGFIVQKQLTIRGETGRAEDVCVVNRKQGQWNAPQPTLVLQSDGTRLSGLTLGCVDIASASVVSNCVSVECYISHGLPGYSSAFVLHASGALVTHCRITAFTNATSYVVQFSGYGGRIENSLFDRCFGNPCINMNNSGELRFVTVTQCGSPSQVVLLSGETPKVIASVVAGNDGTGLAYTSSSWWSVASAANNLRWCVTDDAAPANDTCRVGTAAEIFRDATKHNYRPSAKSPAGNLIPPDGLDFAPEATDLRGSLRLKGKAYDAGCFESVGESGLMVLIR